MFLAPFRGHPDGPPPRLSYTRPRDDTHTWSVVPSGALARRCLRARRARIGIHARTQADQVPDALRETERRLERLHAASFGWALACCAGDEAEAADTLHDAYLKVLDGRARFAGRSSFRTFLFGVVRRTALERRRRRRTRVLLAKAWGRERATTTRGRDPVVRSERSRMLAHALGQLSTRQREVLHLVFYEEMTIEEASAVLGTSLGTARTHYERGKRRLRRLLAAYFADGRHPPSQEPQPPAPERQAADSSHSPSGDPERGGPR